MTKPLRSQNDALSSGGGGGGASPRRRADLDRDADLVLEEPEVEGGADLALEGHAAVLDRDDEIGEYADRHEGERHLAVDEHAADEHERLGPEPDQHLAEARTVTGPAVHSTDQPAPKPTQNPSNVNRGSPPSLSRRPPSIIRYDQTFASRVPGSSVAVTGSPARPE